MLDNINQIIAAITVAASLVGAVYALIVNRAKINNWFKQRRLRREKLDELIDSADNLKCGSKSIKVVSDQMLELQQIVEALATTQNETIKHNRRQDAEIEKSLEQRELTNKVLYVVLDGLKQLGANGLVTKTHEELSNLTIKYAHQNLDYEKGKKKNDK